MPVIGIPEGTALRVDGKQLTLIGRKKVVVYGLGGKPLRAGARELAELKLLHRA
jgi:hypothetical protein